MRSHHGKFLSWVTPRGDVLVASRTSLKAELGELLFLGDLFRSLPLDADSITLFFALPSPWQSLTPLYLVNFMSLHSSFGD